MVLPDYRSRGIGTEIARRLIDRYAGFHQIALLAYGKAVDFYRRVGFRRAGHCEPLWIYTGDNTGLGFCH